VIEGITGSIPVGHPMCNPNSNINSRFLKEARECSKKWAESKDEFVRSSTARLLESHRLANEANCQECDESASYSRFLEKPSPVTGCFIEYFCSIHAPEDAKCFIVENARHKFK